MGEKQNIMQKLIDRITPFFMDDSLPPSHGFVDAESDVGNTVELIVYRISITTKTGRFEKR